MVIRYLSGFASTYLVPDAAAGHGAVAAERPQHAGVAGDRQGPCAIGGPVSICDDDAQRLSSQGGALQLAPYSMNSAVTLSIDTQRRCNWQAVTKAASCVG